MALEIEGTLRSKLPVQSGTSARGEWARQEFVVEFPDGNFRSQACFTAWGQEKVNELTRYHEGDAVKVSFNLRSREYNGRWYNDLQMWRLSPVGSSAAAPAAVAPSYPQAPAPTAADIPAEDNQADDDLPF